MGPTLWHGGAPGTVPPYHGGVSTLPASVRVALWATAAYAGSLALPAALARALPDVHHVTGDLDRLALWRELGERVVLVALPRPGDLGGLPHGHPDLTAAAVEAGECVYVPALGGALVPCIEEFGPEGDRGTQVTWTAYDCDPVPVHRLEALSMNEIELRFRQDLQDCTRRIDALEAKPWAGSPLRAMADERTGRGHWGLPEGLAPRAHTVLAMAATVGVATELGLAHGSPALSSTVDERRRALLAELASVADHAVADAATVAALALAGLRPGRRD